MSKIFILDDTCKSNSGGTALTLNAITENAQPLDFSLVETKELTEDFFNKTSVDDSWIIGNVLNVGIESMKILSLILMYRKFSKIEFDYGFCKYRCEQGFKHFTGKDEWEPFGEHGSKLLEGLYDLIHRFAYKIFYMSKAQMYLHNKMLRKDYRPEKQIVLGSCFSINDLSFMMEKYIARKDLSKSPYAIIDGNGGWHSKAKGIKESILYAKANGLEFRLINENNRRKFLELLSRHKGLIFLPQIHDTCPRVTIEAKLMGLDLIANENCQHATEEWFGKDGEELANYLLDRPYFFRKEISGMLA